MLDKSLIKKLLDNNIEILTYIILKDVESEKNDYVVDPDFQDYIKLLVKDDLLSSNSKLTVKSKELLAALTVPDNKYVDFYEFLHKRLVERLIKLTGKKQIKLQGKYSFMPNVKDLTLKLQKVIKKYNIEDYQKIEKVLLKYIDLCYRANFDKVMLIEYYIMKDNSSKFATDYEDFDENEDSELKTDEGVYLI